MTNPSRPSACRRAEALQAATASGRSLTPDERAFVAVHRADCLPCRAEAAAAALLADQGDGGPAPRLTDLEERRLVNAVLAEAQLPVAATASPEGRPRSALLFGALAAGLAGAGLLVGLLLRPASTPRTAPPPAPGQGAQVARVLLRVGEVDVDGPGPGGAPAAGGGVTVGNGQAVLGLGSGTRVLLGARTRLQVLRLDPGDMALRLERGQLLAQVPPRLASDAPWPARALPRPDRRRFLVLTPAGRVEVTGTVFQVTVAGTRTWVGVARGSVRVAVPGRASLEVSAGSAVTLEEGRDIRLRALGEKEQQELRAAQRATETLRPPAMGALESSQAPVPQENGLPVRPDGAGEPPDRTGPSVQPMPGGRPASSPPRVVAPPIRSAAQLLLDARQHRQAMDWQGAEATYRLLLRHHDGSAEARSARVSLGLLLLAHRGDAAGALKLFDAYLAQPSSGPLAEEAAYGRIRALERLGRLADERAACAQFLRRFPQAFTASLVRRRLDALNKDPVASPPGGH